MTTQHGAARWAGIVGISAFLMLALSMAGGCASSEGRNSGGATASANDNNQEARCRAAIADVTRHCNAENANASRCEDAKARSRTACI